MTDLSKTIEPKSDQLNADDLIPGPMTVTVKAVKLLSEADQPIAIDHDKGRPYKPCKSMRRVMVQLWGPDGAKYAGRRMTLFRDPDVLWGGAKVGGIRISHMSDIDGPKTMALTASKSNRKPYTVKPLGAAEPSFDVAAFVSTVETHVAEATSAEDLKSWWDAQESDRRKLAGADKDKSAHCRSIVASKLGELAAGSDV